MVGCRNLAYRVLNSTYRTLFDANIKRTISIHFQHDWSRHLQRTFTIGNMENSNHCHRRFHRKQNNNKDTVLKTTDIQRQVIITKWKLWNAVKPNRRCCSERTDYRSTFSIFTQSAVPVIRKYCTFVNGRVYDIILWRSPPLNSSRYFRSLRKSYTV